MRPLPGSLVRNVSWNLHRVTTGVDAARAARELERWQWLSPDELREHQDRRLRELIADVGRHVPYFRRVLAEAGLTPEEFRGLEDLPRLPLLTKDLIDAHRDELFREGVTAGDLKANSTGGSTGRNLRFFQDTTSRSGILGTQAVNARWMGADAGAPMAYIWGSPIEHDRAKAFKGKLKNRLQNVLYLSCFGMDAATMDRYAAELQDFRPAVLIGYPTALSEMANHLLGKGMTPPPVGAIVSTSEVLLPQERTLVERGFGAKVFDRYGCREVGDIAHECDRHRGLHLNAGRLIVELIDDGELPDDVDGEVVVTDLDNRSFPFVRYRMGDLATWAEGPCDCGRGLPMFSAVGGRKFDLVRTADGKVLPGTFWTHLFRSIPGVRAFQVVQKSIDRLEVKIVPEAGLADDAEAWFAREIAALVGDQLRAEFTRVSEIERQASGKRRFVVSEIVS